MELIRVGNILNTFGIKGELKVQILTDFPMERFQVGNLLYVNINNEIKDFKIKAVRYHKNNALILFDEYEDINLVEFLKGKDLFVNKDDVEALNDGFYSNSLLGLDVFDQGEFIGKIANVEFYPAHSILRVKNEEIVVLIPFIDAFVKKVDLDEKRVDVELIEGMR